MLKIERMAVVNKQRGAVTVLARFDVNLGPITIKGYELVRWNDGNVNISEPYNLYTPRGESKPKRFTYIFYNGDRGKKIQEQIDQMAKAEYQRRAAAPAPQQSFGGGLEEAEDEFPF